QSLSHSQPDWGDAELPARLRAQADETWALLCALADVDPDEASAIHGRLEAVRAEYIQFYAEAEAGAQSSALAAAHAARLRALRPSRGVLRTRPRLPLPIRHAVPLRGRIAIARALHRVEPRRLAPR